MNEEAESIIRYWCLRGYFESTALEYVLYIMEK